jgi:hypothetical protein
MDVTLGSKSRFFAQLGWMAKHTSFACSRTVLHGVMGFANNAMMEMATTQVRYVPWRQKTRTLLPKHSVSTINVRAASTRACHEIPFRLSLQSTFSQKCFSAIVG